VARQTVTVKMDGVNKRNKRNTIMSQRSVVVGGTLRGGRQSGIGVHSKDEKLDICRR
jgi:hypothetical protein